MTGGEARAAALTAAGVEHLFAVPGASGMGLTDAVMKSGKPAYVLAPHEVCAVSMADGYAKTMGRPWKKRWRTAGRRFSMSASSRASTRNASA